MNDGTAEVNTLDIVNAYKKQLDKINNIKELHNKIINLNGQMLNKDFPDVIKLYSLVFKNIHTDKKLVCDIDQFNSSEYGYYQNQEKGYKRKLFLNRDGFSLSDSFSPNDKREVDTSRTNYLTSYNANGFIKGLKRLFKHKNEIISSIEKEYKKSIAIRFFQAFEESDCDKVFDYDEDFNMLTQNDVKKKIFFYNSHKMETIFVEMFQYRNASNSIQVSKSSGYSTRNQIDLGDIEKLSQIYIEVMAFLNQYYSHLEIQDKSLTKFYTILKDLFARELIVDSLKEQPTK